MSNKYHSDFKFYTLQEILDDAALFENERINIQIDINPDEVKFFSLYSEYWKSTSTVIEDIVTRVSHFINTAILPLEFEFPSADDIMIFSDHYDEINKRFTLKLLKGIDLTNGDLTESLNNATSWINTLLYEHDEIAIMVPSRKRIVRLKYSQDVLH